MSMQVDMSAFAGTDPVFVIAEEVFAAMIDGEPGFLRHWDGDQPPILDEMHAWVDVRGTINGRVLLSTERSTADDLARALLQMGPTEPVSDEDFADALGEVANIVGGNVKALAPEPGVLTLPQVTHERPHTDPEALIYELPLDWRGSLVVIGLWRLP